MPEMVCQQLYDSKKNISLSAEYIFENFTCC